MKPDKQAKRLEGGEKYGKGGIGWAVHCHIAIVIVRVGPVDEL